MNQEIKRIAISTGGGDAPGLNAVIHSVVYAAERVGWEVYGIRQGYDGILFSGQYTDGGMIRLTVPAVENIAHLGGTVLGTTNRGNPFKIVTRLPDGTVREEDRSMDLVEGLKQRGIDALVAVGGDGSLTIADQLHDLGVRVVGVPKTIDNDLESTLLTFGFNSAFSFATECIDRLKATAASHRRIMVVEVMGRYVGWIALNCGIASRADAILIPEIPYDIRKVAEHLKKVTSGSREHAIVVVAEGAKPLGGELVVKSKEAGRVERLGGIGEMVARQLQELTGRESRAVVLGHLLRGGSPTALDRILGLSFGAAAVYALKQGQNGVMVALNPPRINFVPLKEAVARLKAVPVDGEGVLVGRVLDVCFGD